MTNIPHSDEQALALDAVVELITIDASAQGGQVLRIVSGPRDGGNVQFSQGGQTVTWRPLPCRITGMSWGGRTGAGEAVLEVAVNDADLLALIAGDDSLIGATVKRITTLRKFLVGEAAAAERHWPEETWTVQTRVARDDETIRWRLAGLLSLDGQHIPARQGLRDVCTWQYRRRVAGAWDNVQADGVTLAESWLEDGGCPYKGAIAYDLENVAIDVTGLSGQALEAALAGDNCSRRVDGCRARFPLPAALPASFLIGLGRRARG